MRQFYSNAELEVEVAARRSRSRALDAMQSYLVAARALSGAGFSGLASELADAACTLAVEYEDL